MRSNSDIIDCAKYGGCNNSANGAGGVGLCVDNTGTVIGHRTAVRNAANSVFTATVTFVFAANSSRPPHLPTAHLRPFRAPGCTSITPTAEAPTCSLHLQPSAVHTATVSLPLDLQCTSHVSMDNWLTSDRHKHRFAVFMQHTVAHRGTRCGQFGP